MGTHAAKRASRPQRVSTKTCVKRGTWGYPEFSAGGDDDRADKSDSVSLNLDADDASETGMDPPSAGVQSFERDRADGMPKMPPSTIEMQNPGKWSPIAYAFLGDAVWELYVRRLFFAPPTRPLEYDLKCKRAVKAEAQDVILRMLVANNIFTDDELRIVKWGRNASYGSIPTRLRGKGKGGHAIYRNASALECVVGYLYMTDLARLEFIMADLGVAIDNVAGDK